MQARLLVSLIVLVLMGACSPSKTLVNENNENECIPPLFSIAFPVVTPQSMNAITTPRQIPPQGNWQMQNSLPFPQEKLSYLGVRSKQHELWFKVPEMHRIYRYGIDNNEWKFYETTGLTLSVPDNLFVANDGAIWGAGIRFTDRGGSEQTYSFLTRFNDAMDYFETVEDVSGFLEAPQVRLISNIAEDQSGLLWFFVAGDRNTLVSFDVTSRQSKQHYIFEIAGGNSNVVIGPDGSVWFQDFANEEIVQYIPSTQEIRTYTTDLKETSSVNLLPENVKATDLFMDHSGRLWMGSYAWLDFTNTLSPEWHKVIESPVFVTDRGLPDSQYIMAYQYSTFQSSNSWYWFTGGSGIVRLDLKSGTWCLVTTGISDVVEDNDHNLWIAVFSHLYKYQLDP